MKMDVREMSGFDSHSFNAVIDKGTPLITSFDMIFPLIVPVMSLVKLSADFVSCAVPGTLDSLLCGHNSRQNAAKMLEEVGRVLKDKGVYILITYGAPTYRLNLLKEMGSWTIKLHVIEKLVGKSDHLWELTNPLPLDNEGSSAETLLGRNPDVHYIYVCTKVG
ncbi:hypothetical protein EUGRSUZ_H04109 [Eucalyptus grandis]|uniref:Uncharacterized protein n=2 Tax=Eucalyptus grandis TaxID=71139 RepID=A0ACC3JX08_EUCGR|nr:hypothetical protein EUGRSUZ_H04109 [Eucalyptus grandis]